VVVGVWHHPLHSQRTLRFWRQKRKQASIEKKNEKMKKKKKKKKKLSRSLSLSSLF